jgi:DNA-binding response OmpR family regulator
VALKLKKRVLLADDDPALRRLIQATLGDSEFDLLQAVDGEEAMRMVQQHHPALLLLDINMPRLDGFQVCRMLKADPATADIKIVMLTARRAETDRQEARNAGADEYFSKPFSPIQLLNRIYALLG